MELRHLRYFAGVAHEGNFRKAAERLHVSQPALSKQVRVLEEELGVCLFDRHSAGARLTIAGKVFQGEVRQILAQVERSILAVRAAETGRSGTLSIGHVGFLASSFMPEALALFRKKFPAVEVKLHEMRSSAQVTALQEGDIEIGLTAAPDRELPGWAARLPVLRTTLCMAVGRGHPLAKAARISLKELGRETILCFRDHKHSSGHAERIRAIFRQVGAKFRPVRLVDEYESLIALIGAGHGITILPTLAAALTSRGILLKPIRESAAMLGFELRAIWRDEAILPQARHFLAVLQAVAGRVSRNRPAQ